MRGAGQFSRSSGAMLGRCLTLGGSLLIFVSRRAAAQAPANASNSTTIIANTSVGDDFEVDQSCAVRGFLNEKFEKQGTTVNGTDWYKAVSRDDYIYYDFGCYGASGGAETAGWIIGKTAPDPSKTYDLDGDGNCDYFAILKTNVTELQYGNSTWNFDCQPFVDMAVTIREVVVITTTITTTVVATPAPTLAAATPQPTVASAASAASAAGNGSSNSSNATAATDATAATNSSNATECAGRLIILVELETPSATLSSPPEACRENNMLTGVKESIQYTAQSASTGQEVINVVPYPSPDNECDKGWCPDPLSSVDDCFNFGTRLGLDNISKLTMVFEVLVTQTNATGPIGEVLNKTNDDLAAFAETIKSNSRGQSLANDLTVNRVSPMCMVSPGTSCDAVSFIAFTECMWTWLDPLDGRSAGNLTLEHCHKVCDKETSCRAVSMEYLGTTPTGREDLFNCTKFYALGDNIRSRTQWWEQEPVGCHKYGIPRDGHCQYCYTKQCTTTLTTTLPGTTTNTMTTTVPAMTSTVTNPPITTVITTGITTTTTTCAYSMVTNADGACCDTSVPPSMEQPSVSRTKAECQSVCVANGLCVAVDMSFYDASQDLYVCTEFHGNTTTLKTSGCYVQHKDPSAECMRKVCPGVTPGATVAATPQPTFVVGQQSATPQPTFATPQPTFVAGGTTQPSLDASGAACTPVPAPSPADADPTRSFIFDGDYNTVIGAARKEEFLCACTASILPAFAGVSCTDVKPGSIVVSYRGAENVLNGQLAYITAIGELVATGFTAVKAVAEVKAGQQGATPQPTFVVGGDNSDGSNIGDCSQMTELGQGCCLINETRPSISDILSSHSGTIEECVKKCIDDGACIAMDMAPNPGGADQVNCDAIRFPAKSRLTTGCALLQGIAGYACHIKTCYASSFTSISAPMSTTDEESKARSLVSPCFELLIGLSFVMAGVAA